MFSVAIVLFDASFIIQNAIWLGKYAYALIHSLYIVYLHRMWQAV